MDSKTIANDATAGATVDVEKLVYGGDGLARLNGQVMLIPLVLPGESVHVRTETAKKGLLRGSHPEILQASPERIAAQCEYFSICGGCHYQHLEPARQLEHKRAILLETLARTGGIQYSGRLNVVSGDPWHYRNRVQLHFRNRQMGFHELGSHAICAVDHCPISSPKLNEVIRLLHDAVKRPEWPSFLRSMEVFTNETDVQLNVTSTDRPIAARFFDWCSELIPGFAPGALYYQAGGLAFRISGGSFFQVNRSLVDRLTEIVLYDLAGSQALDLYAGVGLFTLPLAQRFSHVKAVERSASAIRDLEFNAQAHGLTLESEKASAEDVLARIHSTPDVILADPPRAGLGKQAVAELLRLKPNQLIIVSCDPTTLARDLKALMPTYGVEEITLVDLFPQTYHLETVVKLRLG